LFLQFVATRNGLIDETPIAVYDQSSLHYQFLFYQSQFQFSSNMTGSLNIPLKNISSCFAVKVETVFTVTVTLSMFSWVVDQTLLRVRNG